MDEFTDKTNEIRRLHEVCRAKNAAVRRAYRAQVRYARQMNHELIQQHRLTGRACDDNDRRSIRRELRDEFLHAARVLKDVLKELEG